MRVGAGVLGFLWAICSGCAAPPPAPLPAPTDVFVSGQAGYGGYRIPALVRTVEGTLLAFCEGRRRGLSDAGDVDLLLSRSHDGGCSWSPAEVVADLGTDFIGNPAPVVDERDGAITVLLTWKAGNAHERDIRAGRQPAAEIRYVRSTDGGRTFTAVRPVPGLGEELRARGWRWNIAGPGHAIQLRHGPHAGRLVCAGNHSAPGGAGNAFLGAHALLSDDGGRSWRLGAVDAAPAGGRRGGVFPNESAVVERTDGSLLFHTRDQGGPAPATRGHASSNDGGATFTGGFAPLDAIVGPVCQGALLGATDAAGDAIVLASLPEDPRQRTRLRIRVSRDGGSNWSLGPLLHRGKAAYSDLVSLAPGRFLALVEVDGYRAIRAIAFSVAAAAGGPAH
ncbi:MAG: exo-alpha-sialidase [Planctomycetes bacterium]|nr:exo-alpha-sialidase [Planctomycetota bacterium]